PMRALLLLLISSLHIVVFAEFNTPCTGDVDCNTDVGEHCLRVSTNQGNTYHCLTFPLPEAESKNLIEEGAMVGNLRKCNVPAREA
ncbi:hypothetical protein BGZ76_008236, partial [Entomortierella beljakovae]